jgi:hypothetical protein
MARLAIENRRLENQVKLAEGKGFYLRLDLDDKRLDLMLQGVALRKHPVARIDLGRPTVVFVPAAAPEGWSERTWEQGRIVPPRPAERLEIVANDGSAEAPEIPEVPPSAEERIPAPDRFEVRYEGGFTLEVVRSDRSGRGIVRRAKDAVRSLTSIGSSDTRLLVALEPSDVAALYRSLPDATSFVVD